MKFTVTLLPGDAAQLLESTLQLLDAVERARTDEERVEALAAARSWVVEAAAALRRQDARGKLAAPVTGQPAASASAPAKPEGKKPCGCDTKQEIVDRGRRANVVMVDDPIRRHEPRPKTGSRRVGEAVARVLLGRAGWTQVEIAKVIG